MLGSPISHSLSPVLHRAAYAALELDWRYEAIECDEAALPGLLSSLDESWAGLSLTMPLKSAVLPLLDEVAPLARAVGAANTVVRRPGGWVGENTDVPGLATLLDEAGVDTVEHAVIIGAGATARSAVAALSVVTRSVTVVGRSSGRRDELGAVAAEVGVELAWVDWAEADSTVQTAPLVVATTPAGATDQLAGGEGLLVDVVYDPWPTPLAARWRGPVVGGLELLVQQAALQVELMTGAGAPVEDMRIAGERALAARP
ncbi:MAG: shikimate dehydrogenase [Frankiales bacterium]|nr:shikimate dehydrogenase [Frankiales bacterium]